MNPDCIAGWPADISKRHDLSHVQLHAFRHTLSSVSIANGQDIVSVSKRLCHAKVSTTSGIYSHIIEEADQRASDCLANVMLRTGTR